MNTLYFTTSLLAHSLSWALLNSLWQGLSIYAALFMLLKILPGTSSRVKYTVSYGAFSIAFIWFADTWFRQYHKLQGSTIYITQTSADSGIAITHPVTATVTDTQGWLQPYALQLEHYMPFIMLIYTAGLLFMLFRFLLSIRGLTLLKTRGIVMCNSRYSDFIAHWQEQLGITRKVRLLLSTHVTVPMMIGAIKPIILVPLATMNNLAPDQVEAILLHELAHIRRHDYLLNMLQAIVETILFFNPFIWLMSGIIRREREHCCDDLVVSCSANPLPYARALAILESERMNDQSFSLAVTGHKNQLFHRIKRIMEMKKSNINYSRFTIILAAVVAVTFTAGILTFTPSWAQKARQEQKAKEEPGAKDEPKDKEHDGGTKKKTVYKSKIVTIDSNGKKTVKEHISGTPGGAGINIEDDDDVTVNMAGGDDDKRQTKIIIRKNKDNDKCEGRNKVSSSIVISADDMEDAMANIDFSGINAEVARANKELDNIDWGKISEEVNNALAEVNKELSNGKLHKEFDIQIKKELERSRETLKKTKIDLEKSRIAMANARTSRVDASNNSIEHMLNKMQAEGLLDRNTKFKVVKEDNELYINGAKQPDDVYRKYKSYLQGDNVTIKGNKGSLTINISNED